MKRAIRYPVELQTFSNKIKHGILLFISFVFLNVSCSSQKKQPSSDLDNAKEDFSALPFQTQNTNPKSDIKPLAGTSTYRGTWFEIKFPASFIASPSSPTETVDTYTFVKTDEATFTSRNGAVAFFVFSPHWGGDPISYLKILKDEEILTDTTEEDKDTPPNTYRWVTVKNTKEGYQRSFYSKKTTSTHLVFGIQYKNQETYDLYKDAYIDFKKSLIQYAD